MRAALPLLLLVIGCGYPPNKFAGDLAEIKCDQYASCDKLNSFGYSDAEECRTEELGALEEKLSSNCDDYDAAAARTCLDDWSALSCEEVQDSSLHPNCTQCGTQDTGL
ncbi:MAG: hypothetical protein QGG40_00495 [Myxococcota bacterium]|jgi:hypothetical protein|nr:hypothetical protein [Myxococcota bacterium]